jgi:hypothetical protein
MGILLTTSSAIILIGAFFKLQHYPYGTQIIWTGFISGFIIEGIEINRLKKIINKLESKEQETE